MLDTAPARSAPSDSGELAGPDYSALDLAVDNAQLIVIDPNGARSGFDSASGKLVQGIPGSGAFQDQLDNDVTGEPAESFSTQIDIHKPGEGMYRIVVLGVAGKPKQKQLLVKPYKLDGSWEPVIRTSLSLDETSRAAFRLHYLKTPGSISRLEKVEPGGLR